VVTRYGEQLFSSVLLLKRDFEYLSKSLLLFFMLWLKKKEKKKLLRMETENDIAKMTKRSVPSVLW